MSRGFSLLEMAMVVLALSLVLAGTVRFLSVQSERNALQKTDKHLREIREALIGFAILEDRLPCPAADEMGRQEMSLCDKEGYLPWADLAIPSVDAWGNIFRYRVDANFAAKIPNELTTRSNLKIKNVAGDIEWTVTNSSATCKKGAVIVDCSRVVAIFFSVGANRQADSRNTGGDATYAHDDYTANFDDRLSWLSVSDLIGGMMRVGNWPPL